MQKEREDSIRAFASWIERWDLAPDGAPIVTHSSRLLPVRYRGLPAMLKVAPGEEKDGGRILEWWNGDGAARVYALQDEAVLMERVAGPRSLVEMARHSDDDAATRILCAATDRLHRPHGKALPKVPTLDEWFAPLASMAAERGGLLAQADAAARELLATPRDVVLLHGDIHHGNILDGGARGWLAIDPKGLLGERTFDYANILRDPDGEVALRPGRLRRQVTVIAEAARVERRRLLQWVLAFCGLSAAWIYADGDSPDLNLAVAALAADELSRTLE
jgi:streptomycin 6-kinase